MSEQQLIRSVYLEKTEYQHQLRPAAPATTVRRALVDVLNRMDHANCGNLLVVLDCLQNHTSSNLLVVLGYCFPALLAVACLSHTMTQAADTHRPHIWFWFFLIIG